MEVRLSTSSLIQEPDSGSDPLEGSDLVELSGDASIESGGATLLVPSVDRPRRNVRIDTELLLRCRLRSIELRLSIPVFTIKKS